MNVSEDVSDKLVELLLLVQNTSHIQFCHDAIKLVLVIEIIHVLGMIICA